jgi:hypothetical protein
MKTLPSTSSLKDSIGVRCAAMCAEPQLWLCVKMYTEGLRQYTVDNALEDYCRVDWLDSMTIREPESARRSRRCRSATCSTGADCTAHAWQHCESAIATSPIFDVSLG